jgi:MOSC domain-containing protein YiiM
VSGRLVQVSVSAGGAPKRAVSRATVTRLGLEGDAHRDRAHHGGPDRALCLFALEPIEALQAEGHAVEPGTLGENLTVAGLAWAEVEPGAVFRVGAAVVLRVTDFTSPCATIRRVFLGGDASRVSQARHPGWSRVYARVLVPGVVAPGDPVRMLTPAAAARQLALDVGRRP